MDADLPVYKQMVLQKFDRLLALQRLFNFLKKMGYITQSEMFKIMTTVNGFEKIKSTKYKSPNILKTF